MSRRLLPEAGGVLFDVDGTLLLGGARAGEDGKALPGAAETVALLRARDVPVGFATNGNRTREYMAASLREAGIYADPDECLSTAVVAAREIARREPEATVLALGPSDVRLLLEEEGVVVCDPSEGARADVVLAAHDLDITNAKLDAAVRALWAGARLYATTLSPRFASSSGWAVGFSGMLAVGLGHVGGVQPMVLGKPARTFLDAAAEMLGVDSERLLVVGDDLSLEIAMAKAAGAPSVLVLTGISQMADAEALTLADRPELVIENLSSLDQAL